MSVGIPQREALQALLEILEPINKHPHVNGFSCVGYAPSRGRRCWNRINAGNRYDFEEMLRKLAGTDLKDARIRFKYLKTLAELSLCVRWHRPQSAEVALRWDRMIALWLRERHPSVTAQLPSVQPLEHARERTSTSIVSSITTRTEPSRTAASPATAPTVVPQQYTTSRREEVVETVERTSGLRSSSSTRRQPVLVQPRLHSTSHENLIESLPSPPRTEFTFTAPRHLVAISESPVSSEPTGDFAHIFAPRPRPAVTLAAQREPTPASVSSTASTTSDQAVPPAPAPSLADSQTTLPPITIPSPTTDSPMLSPVSATAPQAPSPSSPPCSDSHAQRKSTDDDCPICQTTLASTPLASLVWCKAQCGTNLHRACWARWEREASSLRGRASLSCVYCRAPWPQPCHHDTTTLPPYSFWSAAAPTSPDANNDADAAGTPLRTLFNPRRHPWSLWSDASASADAPLPRLFDPRRHSRPRRASRLAAADADDDMAASLARLFNPRDHARADAWSVWGRPVEEALGLAVLHDARRHRRALRCERGRGSRVLEEGGVLEGLFDEGAGVEKETEERRPRRVGSGCRMVYVTVLEERGVEAEGEEEGRKWRAEGLCERVAGWACGRW